MSRKYLIAGNWKMNKTPLEAGELLQGLAMQIGNETGVDVVVCPPFTALESAQRYILGSSIAVGAQNMHAKESGAYTGEISAPMLKALTCRYVILGHSERREFFGETDAAINEKTLAALEADLIPIVCVGETLDQREADKTKDVVTEQITGCLKDVPASKAAKVVIAYEPVWAIGTGKTATPEMAQEVHALIRELLRKPFGDAADEIRILYGGSMKPENASELLDQADVDGGLIGGASLKADSFAELVKIAKSKV